MTDPPASVGRYEIRGELGRGMMGIVYEAHDPALGRDIALKTIQLAFSVTPEERVAFEKRFLTEARVAAALSHPGIVVVHDVGRDGETGTLFMALERLQGRTLDRVIAERGTLPWREAIAIIARVARALHHAHAKGVIHRDVKPANVMILPSGELKVMDFGIAKLDTGQLTAAGQFFGTPLYMSPEQARAGKLDARSDQFSLGALLYELLTGQKAFAGETVTQIIVKVVSRDPPPLRLPGLPDSLPYVVARCLAKDPTDRYPDCAALAEDLDDLETGHSPRHRPVAALPAAAGGTVVSPQGASLSGSGADSAIPDLAAALEGLVSPTAGSQASGRPAVAAASRPRPLVPAPAPQAGGLLGSPFLPYVVAAAGLLVAVLLLASRGSRAPDSTPSRSLREDPSAAEPREPAGTPSRSSPPAPPPPPPDVARLAVSFEHSLKHGSLQVSVDDEVVIEQALDSRVTRKVLSLRFRKGSLTNTLDLEPGKHEVRLRVEWDDNVKAESIWANFEPGKVRTLKARLGGFAGIRTGLSLEWQ